MSALNGIRVLDLTRLFPGPYATMLLADLGADVLKIEDPHGGDWLRDLPPRAHDQNVTFAMLNRGKKSVALDLKTPEGRTAFLKLASTSDVIVEGFRPGVVDRLGIGYGEIQKIRPDIIYCSLTGYGQDGPLRDAPGHDLNYLGRAGFLANGSIPAAPMADIAGGGHMAVLAILAALLARQRGEGGRYLDVSMYDGVLSWMFQPAAFALAGQPTPPRGLLTGDFACYGIYQTLDDRRITLAALEPKFWEAFCTLVGHPEWIPMQFDAQMQDDLRREVESVVRTRSQEDWLRLGLPIGPVHTIEEAVQDAIHRGLVVDRQFVFPVKGLALAPRPAPKLGEHTAETNDCADTTPRAH